MNTLDLWKNVGKLSVDESMCLIFGLVPGTVKFDYGNPDKWPRGAVPVYIMLTKAIQSGKLHVFIEDSGHDPRRDEELASQYFHSDEPWWVDGKLSKYALKKWLVEKNIPSDFFGVAQGQQMPDQDAVTEEKPIKSEEARSEEPRIISNELANNIYYLPAEWLTEKPTEHKFCVNPLVPIGTVTLLNAHAGSGKSLFALTMAIHIALGLPIIGAETSRGKVAYMSLEDPENVVQERMFKVFNELPDGLRQIDELAAKIMIIDRYGLSTYVAANKYGNNISPQIAGDLSLLLKEHKITCLFVDTFIRTDCLNESDHAQMGRLLATYEWIAKDAECGLVLLHHLPKGDANMTAARGTSAIIDNAKSAMLLEIVNDKEASKLAEEDIKPAGAKGLLIGVTHTKHNYSTEHPKQYLVMTLDGTLKV